MATHIREATAHMAPEPIEGPPSCDVCGYAHLTQFCPELEDEDEEEITCHECEWDGVVTYYPGGYGSYYCTGPAEKICAECGGIGVLSH